MKSATSFAVALAIGALMSGTAYANNPYHFMNGDSLFGQPATAAQRARTVDVATAKYVDARYGEAVKFMNGSQTFTWVFNGLGQRAVDLSMIAPAGFVSRPLMVYVDRDPATGR